MEDKFKVGIVTSTHGLKGEVKVFPTTDDARRYDALKSVFLGDCDNARVCELEHVRYHGKLVIVKLRGCDTIEEAQLLRGKELYVKREDAVPLGDGEYYIADLIGMEVFTDEKMLGKLTDVIQTGANDVYCVSSDEYGEVLIPAIKQCILEIDVEKGMMKVELMNGLLPEKKSKGGEA